MSDPYIKNFPQSETVRMEEMVDYAQGQVVSRTLAQNDKMSMTLFAFPGGEGLSAHKAPGDALVQVLDGRVKLTIDGEPHELGPGESLVMPADIPHSLDALSDFKMLLTIVKG